MTLAQEFAVYLRRLLLTLSCTLAIIAVLPSRHSTAFAAADHFQPVSPEELKMTSEPLAPGAPAVILFRQLDRDDVDGVEFNYFRIKILAEEGRKQADIEIPFLKEMGIDIYELKARTIEPDGTIVNFDGKPYEKSIAKTRGFKVMAKTFTFPNVQVGSILEYYYMVRLPLYRRVSSEWVLNDELFTKHARFSLLPSAPTRWTWHGRPEGIDGPKLGKDKFIRLEVNNMAAFRKEDYMPPEDEVKARVDFISTNGFVEDDVDKFWGYAGMRLNDEVESFIGKSKAMERAVAEIVSPGDIPEIKVRKIYDRVQSIRNTDSEEQKTEQERRREKEKPVSSAEELWKKGYGNGNQLTLLFLALVRAAGIEAYPIKTTDRRRFFFNPQERDSRRLYQNVVLVKIGGKEIFCDPGAAFTPLGLLPWGETAVPGLRLSKDGVTWLMTLTPESSASKIERRASFNLSATGDLEGKLTITFTGLEGMERRLELHHQDDAARKQALEEQAREYIAAASEVELTNKPDWTSSTLPLIAEYDVKIPGWAASAGKRSMFPVGIFSATEKRVFDHTERIHPIYFEFPFENVDDVTVTLPPEWQVSSIPQEQNISKPAVGYLLKAEKGKDSIHLTRTLRIDLILIDAKYYPALRDFFQTIRHGDEQQIVLLPGATNAAN